MPGNEGMNDLPEMMPEMPVDASEAIDTKLDPQTQKMLDEIMKEGV